MGFRKMNGEWTGIVNDYDLSVILLPDYRLPQASSRHRTGTSAFMACELLEASGPDTVSTHAYYHDLESLFYVRSWITLGYGSPHLTQDILQQWKGSVWKDVATAKSSFIQSNGEDTLIYHTLPSHKTSLPATQDILYIFQDALGDARNAVRRIEDKRQRNATRHASLTRDVTWRKFATAVGVDDQIILELDRDDSKTMEAVMAELG
jgi:hypothetical protein